MLICACHAINPTTLSIHDGVVPKFLFFYFFILFERDVPMTPYNYLRSQHCNASWRGQFMYIAQLAPHTTFNTYWVWPRGDNRPSRVETFPRSHPETTFQVYKHFDLTVNRNPDTWIESANHYITDPLTNFFSQ